MATYKDAGIDIDLGDKCSAIAYEAARGTFVGRKGMIAEPIIDDGGFTGAVDMGDYLLVQNDDGVGTKIIIAEKIKKFDTLGYDLVAMVADDAACVGAETIIMTNTIDTNKLDEDTIRGLMSGLQKAALENKIAVVGGEIAELGSSLNGYVWNSTATGIVEKSKLITGKDIKVGDKIIGLKSGNFRSNGFSLVRYVLNEKFGENWYFEKYNSEKTWGEAVLDPCIVYTKVIMDIHGRFKQPSKAEIKGIVHVTGGGIPGNIMRVLKRSNLGAVLDNLPQVPEVMRKIIEIGNVPKEEVERTFNLGVGMILISNDVEKITEICTSHKVEAQVIGTVVESGFEIK